MELSNPFDVGGGVVRSNTTACHGAKWKVGSFPVLSFSVHPFGLSAIVQCIAVESHVDHNNKKKDVEDPGTAAMGSQPLLRTSLKKRCSATFTHRGVVRDEVWVSCSPGFFRPS